MITTRTRSNGALVVEDGTEVRMLPATITIDIWSALGIVQLSAGGKHTPEQTIPVGGKASFMVGGDYKITIERVRQPNKVIKLRKKVQP